VRHLAGAERVVSGPSGAILYTRRRAGAIEIERKFLVRDEEWQKHATARDAPVKPTGFRRAIVTRVHYKQCDLRSPSNPKPTCRLEIEYAVSVPDAEALMALRYSGLIERRDLLFPGGEARGRSTSSRATTAV
jgi:hypothetical protein